MLNCYMRHVPNGAPALAEIMQIVPRNAQVGDPQMPPPSPPKLVCLDLGDPDDYVRVSGRALNFALSPDSPRPTYAAGYDYATKQGGMEDKGIGGRSPTKRERTSRARKQRIPFRWIPSSRPTVRHCGVLRVVIDRSILLPPRMADLHGMWNILCECDVEAARVASPHAARIDTLVDCRRAGWEMGPFRLISPRAFKS